MKYKLRLQYQPTNNEVEYEALLKGLELAKSVEAKSVLVLGDSQLVMGQVNRKKKNSTKPDTFKPKSEGHFSSNFDEIS